MLDVPCSLSTGRESSAGRQFTRNVKHYFLGKPRKISQYLLFSADSWFNTFGLKRNGKKYLSHNEI